MSINVHTEWGKLNEVIVGSVFNATDHNVDLSFKLFFNDNIQDVLLKNSIHLQKKLILERQADLDSLAETLKNLGIIVHRPDTLQNITAFKTPYFTDHQSPSDNPRDQVLIYKNKIIETPSIWRKRYFENDLLKKIFYQKFEEGAEWISAPKPMMKDESYDLDYARHNKNCNIDWNYHDGIQKSFEIMFDGAQCLKLGKDILMNVANKNHELGFKWLSRTLGSDVRIHPVNFCDHHIDSMLMPIEAGTMLISSGKMELLVEKLPTALQKWKKIIVPVKNTSSYDVNLASGNINTNVLPIGNRTLITFNETNELEPQFRDILESNNFKIIHCRLRHSRLFGGGAHCVTLDLNRDDEFKSYI